jgi:hypothetical protein
VSNEAEIYNASMAGYTAAIVEEQAAYQKAQLTGDINEAIRASQAIASLRTQANEYHRMASEHASTLRQPTQGAQNKYGLSQAEIEIAHNSYGAIKDKRTGQMLDLTPEEKEEAYVRNREKYRAMVRDGSYSNDQGSVRR